MRVPATVPATPFPQPLLMEKVPVKLSSEAEGVALRVRYWPSTEKEVRENEDAETWPCDGTVVWPT